MSPDTDGGIVGLIPAAGEGTRLGLPYPKELQPMVRSSGYKPAAQFAVESIVDSGAKHVVFVINETKHQLMEYFGDGRRFGANLSYVVQDRSTPRESASSGGLADALDAAYHLTRGKTVYFAMADTILRPRDIFARIVELSPPSSQLMLGLFPVTRPEKFGMVDFSADGTVRKIIDKPAKTELKHAWGCIAWREQFTEHLHECVREGGMGDFAAIMNQALEKGMGGSAVPFDDGRFADMGTFEEIIETERWYRELPDSEV